MRELAKLPTDAVIIHGGCRGADKQADAIARLSGLKVREFPANWTLGKKAGPIRNQQMLKEGKPNLVLAFHENIENSKGTKDMINRAKKDGVEVQVFSK